MRRAAGCGSRGDYTATSTAAGSFYPLCQFAVSTREHRPAEIWRAEQEGRAECRPSGDSSHLWRQTCSREVTCLGAPSIDSVGRRCRNVQASPQNAGLIPAISCFACRPRRPHGLRVRWRAGGSLGSAFTAYHCVVYIPVGTGEPRRRTRRAWSQTVHPREHGGASPSSGSVAGTRGTCPSWIQR